METASDTGPLGVECLAASDNSEGSREDLDRYVLRAVANAIAISPAGSRVDHAKLSKFLADNIGRLLKKKKLNFEPILQAVLKVRGVNERDLYIATLNLGEQLHQKGVEMPEPQFSLSHRARAELLEEAHAATEAVRHAQQAKRLHTAVKDLTHQRIGDLLVQEGLVNEEQISEALKAQEDTGNRLGTNLVQLGYLSAEDLASFLGQQLGLPFLLDIDQVSEAAVASIPQELAIKHQVMPVALQGRSLTLAMVDPTDLDAIDELSFRTDTTIHPVVAPELCVLYAHARHYHVGHQARFFLRDPATPGGSGVGAVSAPSQELDPHREAPHHGTDGLQHLSRALLRAERPEHVLKLLNRYMYNYFSTCAVYLVEGDRVRGWIHLGAKISPEAFSLAELPIRVHPLIQDGARSGKIYRGPGSFEVGSFWLTESLGLGRAAFISLIPIIDHERKVTAFLLGHGTRKGGKVHRTAGTNLQAVATSALTMVEWKRRLRAAAGDTSDETEAPTKR